MQNVRHGAKVKQQVIKYLGKHGWSKLEPIRFTNITTQSSTDAALRKKLEKAFTTLGYRTQHNAPLLPGVDGEVNNRSKLVSFAGRPAIDTIAHELGHVIDFYIQYRSVRGFVEDVVLDYEFDVMQIHPKEAKAVQDYYYADEKYRMEKFKRWIAEQKTTAFSNIGMDALASTMFFREYVYTHEECFANIFALCLTEPRKARNLAPNLSSYLMELCYDYPKVREAVTSLEAWELGTT